MNFRCNLRMHLCLRMNSLIHKKNKAIERLEIGQLCGK